MKTTSSAATLGGLLAVLAVAVSGQAAGAPFPSIGQESAFMLAESGSDRLMEYRLQRDALAQSRATSDESERFAQVLKEQPTAAGPQFESEDAQPAIQYKSPIHRDRAEQGLH
ncbi:MAG: hypothetical protein ACRERY_10135 [Pseudomonas sp.]